MNHKSKRRSGFARIDKVLPQTAKNYHLEPAVQRYQVLKYWQLIIEDFFSDAKSLTKAIDFKKGVLTVACLSRQAATELRLLVPRLIQAINKVLGRSLVFAIYIEC
jgi:hypothetical protein